MSDLVDAIAGTLGDILGLPVVGLAGRLVVVVALVLWVAAAWWAWRDADRRSPEPLLRYLATAGIILATPVFFPLAVLLYVLVRPPLVSRGDEALEVRLAALDREPAERCPGCGIPVDDGWQRCPTCGTTLTVPCPACGRVVRPAWQLCAWCAAELAPLEEGAATSQAPALPLVSLPIVPGGPSVPVVAVPEQEDAAPTAGAPARTTSRTRRRHGAPDMGTPHDPGGDRTVRRAVRDRPRHRHDRGGWFA